MFRQYPSAFLADPEPSFDLIKNSWYPGFCAHKLYENLDDVEEELVEEIITDLTGFLLYYHNCPPEEWTEEQIRHCLLTDYPRSLLRDDDYIYSALSVLKVFFIYLDDSGLINCGDELVSMIDTDEYLFIEEMEDEENYSLRKRILFVASYEGIDVNDADSVVQYFKEIGQNVLDDDNPELVDAISTAISSFGFPFSDSRHAAAIPSAKARDVCSVIPVLCGSLINESNQDPKMWKPEDVSEIITEQFITYPLEKETREVFIPIIVSLL